MCFYHFLEVTQVAVLSDQHKRLLPVYHSGEEVVVSNNVRAFELFEQCRFFLSFLEPILVRVHFGN